MQKMEKCLVSGNTFVNEWLINLWKVKLASIVFDVCGSPKTSCPGENYLDQHCCHSSESLSEHRARQVLDFQALCNYVKGISCSTYNIHITYLSLHLSYTQPLKKQWLFPQINRISLVLSLYGIFKVMSLPFLSRLLFLQTIWRPMEGWVKMRLERSFGRFWRRWTTATGTTLSTETSKLKTCC